MQLDLFEDARILELSDLVLNQQRSLDKVRRSLYARINELEREVLTLRDELDTIKSLLNCDIEEN